MQISTYSFHVKKGRACQNDAFIVLTDIFLHHRIFLFCGTDKNWSVAMKQFIIFKPVQDLSCKICGLKERVINIIYLHILTTGKERRNNFLFFIVCSIFNSIYRLLRSGKRRSFRCSRLFLLRIFKTGCNYRNNDGIS